MSVIPLGAGALQACAHKLPCNSLSCDAFVAFPGIGKQLNHQTFIGWKPPAFSYWLFADLLAARPGDELEDLYPGSGAIRDAWETWQRQGQLWAVEQPPRRQRGVNG
jgi:hypothetical protein